MTLHHTVGTPTKLMANFFPGYWSSGIRLADSARVAGEGIEEGDLPEYLVSCWLDDHRRGHRGVL